MAYSRGITRLPAWEPTKDAGESQWLPTTSSLALIDTITGSAWHQQVALNTPDIHLLGGKLGEVEADLTPALQFLVSDAARYITSQIITVDGDLTYTR